MHTKNYFGILTLAGLLSTAALTGCVDQDYSLDDIDLEMQFQFDDLVLPVNMAPVKLSSIIDIADEDDVEIVDGKYVLLRSGEVNSSEINIKAFNAKATAMNDIKKTITLPVVPDQTIPLQFIHKFNYNYDDVDKHILSIESGEVDMDFSITISTKYTNGNVLNAQFENLSFALPKGFYGTLNTGEEIKKGDDNIVHISPAAVNEEGKFTFNFHVTEFDTEAAGADFDSNNGVFTLESSMGIESGSIKYTDGPAGQAEISVEVAISPLEIKKISGWIDYVMDEWSTIVDFNNLPDVLTDSQTNLKFYNPQVYLSLTNPLGESAYALTDIEITQNRTDGPVAAPVTLSQLEIKQKFGAQDYCLLPRPDEIINYHGYPDAEPLLMKNLGNIVAGNGFPKSLTVSFENPGFPKQPVQNFPLDFNGVISGKYTLFAPLQLEAGSTLFYQDTATGWGVSTDSDEMNIQLLTLEADATSHLPVSVIFTAQPINSNGEIIKNIKVDKVEIVAGQTKHITITMEGNIDDLDGMKYTASLKSADDSRALTPESYIELQNLKVKVTGNYIVKEDKD